MIMDFTNSNDPKIQSYNEYVDSQSSKQNTRTVLVSSMQTIAYDNGLPVEIGDGLSAEVLLRVEGHEGLQTGRYSHNLGRWWLGGFIYATHTVVEWWPLPKEGTGVKVSV